MTYPPNAPQPVWHRRTVKAMRLMAGGYFVLAAALGVGFWQVGVRNRNADHTIIERAQAHVDLICDRQDGVISSLEFAFSDPKLISPYRQELLTQVQQLARQNCR